MSPEEEKTAAGKEELVSSPFVEACFSNFVFLRSQGEIAQRFHHARKMP